MKNPGYIYIVNWSRYQHYKDRRPAWIKLYLDLLHKDEYLRLSLADRGLLHDLWKLASVSGDGRVSADRTLLARQLNVRRVSLEPLIQAGFIRIRASKALAARYQDASAEGSKEPKRKNAREALAPRAAPARVKDEDDPTPTANGWHGAAEARAQFLQSVKTLDPAKEEAQ